MKSHFHMKGWAPRLALRKVIRKLPIGLHSVLLPLLIPDLSRPALKTVLLYCFYCIRGQFWFIAFRRKGKGKEKLVSLIYSNPFPFITSITAVASYADAPWARHAIRASASEAITAAVTFLQSLSSPFYKLILISSS